MQWQLPPLFQQALDFPDQVGRGSLCGVAHLHRALRIFGYKRESQRSPGLMRVALLSELTRVHVTAVLFCEYLAVPALGEILDSVNIRSLFR